MTDSNLIKQALAKLDVSNDNHWTAEGQPRIDTVKMLASDQTITRDDITKASPEFTRETATAALAQAPVAQAPVAQTGQGSAGAGSNEPPVDNQPPAIQETAAIVDPVNLDEYDAAIADAWEAVDEMNQARVKFDEEYAKRVKAYDAAVDAKVQAGAGETVVNAIQGYHESQKRLLQARADRGRTLQEAGLTAKDLSALLPGRSPIDAAMGRKTSRGTQRPVR
jgi:hypothetical protein